MIRVNLIPYREERRNKQIFNHIMAAVSVVGSALVLVFVVQWFYTSKLDNLNQEFASLKAQNQVLLKKIGKIKDLDRLREDVTRKLELVDSLQKGRFRSLENLLALSEAIPDAVWLKSAADKGGSLVLEGFGDSNKAVANFMRALDKSPRFADVRLKLIQRDRIGDMPVRKFELSMQFEQSAQEPLEPDGKKASGRKS